MRFSATQANNELKDKLANQIAAKLGVDDEKEEAVPKATMLKEYQEHYRKFLRPVVQLLSGSQRGSSAEVKLTVPQNFELQTLFERWFTFRKSDGAFLFQDDNYMQKLVSRWNVQYDQTLEMAIDQGGPSREFFHQVWKQMVRLKVSYKPNGASVALFTEESVGLVPQKNEMLEIAIEQMVKEARSDKLSRYERDKIREVIWEKVKAMYRAIGRIMARCMLSLDQRTSAHVDDDMYFKFLISAKCLPIFYRNGKSRTSEL